MAIKVKRMSPSVPAIKEPIEAIPKAIPPRPALAIGYPSNVVTTLALSPGTFSKTDVMDLHTSHHSTYQLT